MSSVAWRWIPLRVTEQPACTPCCWWQFSRPTGAHRAGREEASTGRWWLGVNNLPYVPVGAPTHCSNTMNKYCRGFDYRNLNLELLLLILQSVKDHELAWVSCSWAVYWTRGYLKKTKRAFSPLKQNQEWAWLRRKPVGQPLNQAKKNDLTGKHSFSTSSTSVNRCHYNLVPVQNYWLLFTKMGNNSLQPFHKAQKVGHCKVEWIHILSIKLKQIPNLL